jgi:hypothetical protein
VVIAWPKSLWCAVAAMPLRQAVVAGRGGVS